MAVSLLLYEYAYCEVLPSNANVFFSCPSIHPLVDENGSQLHFWASFFHKRYIFQRAASGKNKTTLYEICFSSSHPLQYYFSKSFGSRFNAFAIACIDRTPFACRMRYQIDCLLRLGTSFFPKSSNVHPFRFSSCLIFKVFIFMMVIIHYWKAKSTYFFIKAKCLISCTMVK